MSPTSAVLTYWFVAVPDPADVLAAEPKADRGFGRKYLAQLNPAWPITPIGQFPLNRSTQVSPGEFYIGGFPGVTVVQTWVEDVGKLTELDKKILNSRNAPDVYVFALGDDSDFGGFVHFSDGVVKRALSGTRNQLYEDQGLPEGFELPYWSGEKAEQIGGISLPFEPKDLAREAERCWIGVDVSPAGPDIQVVGYAVDGRPEPKVDDPKKQLAARRTGEEKTEVVSYDDYEIHTDTGEGGEFTKLARAAGAAAKRVGRGVVRRAGQLRENISERIRHSDRP